MSLHQITGLIHVDSWYDYSRAGDMMLEATDTQDVPTTPPLISSNRFSCSLLSQVIGARMERKELSNRLSFSSP